MLAGCVLALGVCLSTFGQATDNPELIKANPAQTQPVTEPTTRPSQTVPDLQKLLSKPDNEMWAIRQRYDADLGNVNRFYVFAYSPAKYARLRLFQADWLAALENLKTEGWSDEGRAARDSLKSTIQSALDRLESDAAAQRQLAPLLPFLTAITSLGEAKLRLEPIDAQKSAAALHALRVEVETTQKTLAAKNDAKVESALAIRAADTIGRLRENLRSWYGFYNDYDPMFTWWTTQSYKEADQALASYATFLKEKIAPQSESATTQPGTGSMAAAAIPTPKLAGKQPDVPDLNELVSYPQSPMRGVIASYGGRGGRGNAAAAVNPNRAGGGRTPQYFKDWQAALAKLDFDGLNHDGQVDYILLRNKGDTDLMRAEQREKAGPLPTIKDESGISGRPIGEDGLKIELAAEMIPYSPAELIDIAEKEYIWCEAEMKKASREMGFGDEWKKAVEKVKTMYVPAGQQPYLIRDLALEATDYVENHDMVTVPEVARESWRSEMMTPQRQLVNPFFTGGETISISYPTSTMSYDSKLESMRGNNIPFSHATVFHELIPGHHLQGFMSNRYRGYRRAFNTPFWIEGWSLYWEIILYDRGFNDTPEKRVGALFWRMHRCARIVFSLGFHSGKMTPQQCIDYLVEKVGHERQNAAAEVRRSFNGSYAPLYQAAYLLGGLQIRGLRHELVDSGKMTEHQFHDALLKENSIPIAMMRASISKEKLTRDYSPQWKFYDALR